MLRVVSSEKVTDKSHSRARPASGKRAENRKLRTESLSRSALALFLQYGVEAVTIDQIVDGARTAKGSFYRYFRDKTDLVESLVRPVRDEVRDAFRRCEGLLEHASSGSFAQAYEALAQDLIRVVLQYPDVIRLYLHEARGPKNGARAPIVELAEEVLDGATRLSDVAHRHGLVRGVVGRLSAIVVVGASEYIVARLFAGDDVGPVLEMPGALVSLVLDGVRARTDPKPASTAPSPSRPPPSNKLAASARPKVKPKTTAKTTAKAKTTKAKPSRR